MRVTLPDRPSTIIVVPNVNKPLESRNEEKEVKRGIGPCTRVWLIPGALEKLVLMEQ